MYLQVDELIVGLYAMPKCDSETIYRILKDIMLRFGINILKVRAACFDGASAFQGRLNGVAQKIKGDQNRVCLTHCHMHCVNLAVQDVVSGVPTMRDFLVLINDMINFFRDSPKRRELVKEVAANLHCSESHIRPMCPTRFTVKFHSLSAINKQLEVIAEALTVITDESSDRKIAAHANGFLEKLGQFEFYFNLKLSLQIFELTDRLSTQLQQKKMSTGQSYNLVTLTITQLNKMRCDDA